MKNLIILIGIVLLALTKSQAQVFVNGVEYTWISAGDGSPADIGSTRYSYDAFPFAPGGVKSIARIGGYWYIYIQGTSSGFNDYFLIARTTVPYPDLTNPPDCAQWQNYFIPPIFNGTPWVGYPTTTPPAPTEAIVSINITGTVGSAGLGTSTQILPEYIELSRKTTATIQSYSNYGGRLLYNICENALTYNNGSQWKNVWPNNTNYDVNLFQRFNFGNTNTQIYAKSAPASLNQLVIRSNNTDRIVLERDGVFNYTQINLKGSVSIPFVSTPAESYTILDSDYTVICSGSITQTITIPSASDNKGRLIIIVNRNLATLTLSTDVQGQGTTLNANANLQILSNGTNWIKIN